jgi:hypothetical protein
MCAEVSTVLRAVVIILRHLSGGTEETLQNITTVIVPSEIRTGHIRNESCSEPLDPRQCAVGASSSSYQSLYPARCVRETDTYKSLWPTSTFLGHYSMKVSHTVQDLPTDPFVYFALQVKWRRVPLDCKEQIRVTNLYSSRMPSESSPGQVPVSESVRKVCLNKLGRGRLLCPDMRSYVWGCQLTEVSEQPTASVCRVED